MVSDGTLSWDKPSIKTLVYLLLPLLFLLIVFPAAVQPDHGFISEYHDALCLILPDYFLIHNPLALWDNQWLTGLSDIASMNSDRFYPLSFPFFFLTQDILVIDFILLLHLYIAYLAFFRLGSLLVKNSELLLIFSLGYMFSGVVLSRIFIGHIFFVYAMAWIPLLFYFFLKITYKSEPAVINILGLAVCETMLLFNAASYYLFFCNAILAVYFLYYLLKQRLSRHQIIAVVTAAVLFSLVGAVKLLPNLLGMAYIQRIDLINPLGDGGLLENNFASFIFGTPIDTVFGPYETMALIGIIPVLFAIIALIWGDREITVPSFFAMIFTLIWADGGRTLVSFIHLLPLISSFRNAGRIFGAIMPILLLLSIYGVSIVQERLRKGELFTVSEDQKRAILYGVGILAAVKLLELPWAEIPSLEAALAVVLVLGFILLMYLDKGSIFNLQCYFSLALLVNILVLIKDFTILNSDVLFKGLLIAILLVAALLLFNRDELEKNRLKGHIFVALLVVGILVSVIGNISVIKPTDPKFEESPALKVIEKIKESSSANPQIWVYESGWPIQHMDFTYWFIRSGIHPMRAFYSYVPLNTPPLALQLNGVNYFTADYLVDTAYLEDGNENLPNVTFKVENISVYRPDHVLSNVFVVRKDTLVPITYEKFTPDEITVSGQFMQGDVAVLKTAFYPGWKVNNKDAIKTSNMPGSLIQADTSTITFRYDPLDAKAGLFLTVIGILALIALFMKRRELERYLKSMKENLPAKKPGKGKKSQR
jgi:hypothetical protein